MDSTAQNQNAISDLAQRKSLLIIQAQFQQAFEQREEAARLFLEAAMLEEKMALHFRQQESADDAAISLFSAASCYKNAGQLAKAVALADEALPLSSSELFVNEIRQFRDACNPALGPRTLRGVVRDGVVHPFESGVLSEGDLVTIMKG